MGQGRRRARKRVTSRFAKPSLLVVAEAVHGRPDNDRPPICAFCGVTMVPAELSMRIAREPGWVCLECEERDEPDET